MRPNNMRKEADAAKALLSIPDGDHLTMLNVFNSYKTSGLFPMRVFFHRLTRQHFSDAGDKNWCWSNYLNARALAQADNVRTQLMRTMERFEVDLLSTDDMRKYYINIRRALVCGFFMQVAHNEGGTKGAEYITVKDNQSVALHPSCGLETQPEWVIFNEFVLTTRRYIRTVTEVKGEW